MVHPWLTTLGFSLAAALPHLLGLTGDEQIGVAATATLSAVLRRPRGRPRKFDEPTRVVSLTLPESAIAHLAETHGDLGRAVVTLIDRTKASPKRPAAELVVFGNQAVISVQVTPSLEERVGVTLVPLPDGRALLSFDAPQTVADLELSISDALDDPTLGSGDRLIFDSIRGILRDARQAPDVTLLRRSIIVLAGTRRAARRRKPSTADPATPS
jgi:hypothetical protein